MFLTRKESDLEKLLSYLQKVDNKQEIQTNIKSLWISITSCLDEPQIESTRLKLCLNCLCQLVIACEEAFKPYASATLYKSLDCLTEREEDDDLRLISLNTIYSLTRYCDEQILPLKNNIGDYMLLLKNGKNEQIDIMCTKILTHYEINNSICEGPHRKALSIQLLSDDSGDFVNFKFNNEDKEFTFKKDINNPPINNSTINNNVVIQPMIEENKEDNSLEVKKEFEFKIEEEEPMLINIDILTKKIKELSDVR